MPELNDHELLAEFARAESETAFATLVARYVNLVYSTALRFTGNSHHAEEITQAVFIILARKAGKLSSRVVLSGWLYQTARLTAANLVKGEIRRHHREQEAYMQSTLNESGATWQQIAPLLDEAMGGLGETDRNAVVLRFFENKTAAEVAVTLKLTEGAAHKRMNRALEKLRKFFTKRGVSSTTAIIAGTISANSVQAAPVALVKSVTAVAIVKGSIATVSTMTLVKSTMKMMAWMKIKFGIGISAIVLLAGGVATIAVSQTAGDDKSAAQKMPINEKGAHGRPSSYSNTGTNISTVNVPTLTAAEAVRNLLRSQKPTSDRDEQLQKLFLQFPFLPSVTNSDAQPDFQTLTLTNQALIDGKKYYGFRFTVPRRKNHEDFVWAFVQPETFSGWYILPQTGIMGGFTNYFYCPKDVYPAADALLPLNGRRLIVQSLAGDALDDGETYLIWFAFEKQNPAHISLTFAFANLETNGLNAIEKALALDCSDYLTHPRSQPIVNPDNHHTYVLLRAATWEESEAQAVAMGGHLATVRNQAEEDWIFKTFGSYDGAQRLLWIGLSDREKKFHFSWSSGESASYTAWAKGEPNNSGRGEDYVSIYYPNHSQSNKWNDWGDKTVDPIGLPIDGVVEIIPKAKDNIVNAAASADPRTANAVVVQINPNISISSHSGSIKLQWPISASGYMLEATTNLSQPFTMFGYSEETNIEAGIMYVTITNPVPQMYFRLQKH